MFLVAISGDNKCRNKGAAAPCALGQKGEERGQEKWLERGQKVSFCSQCNRILASRVCCMPTLHRGFLHLICVYQSFRYQHIDTLQKIFLTTKLNSLQPGLGKSW